MTLSGDIATWLIDQRFRALPPENLLHTVEHVGDQLAIAIAARETSSLAQQVRNCFLLPGEPVTSTSAAFVLSAYTHILDFDDIHDVGRVHPACVIMPAALAAASMQPTTYENFFKAVSTGSELLCRLGLAWKPMGTGPGSDWFLTQLFGYFAAAATAGMVLGLDREQLQSALGLAYMQAAGGKEAGFGTGGNARSIYSSFAAMGGMQAALLARAGLVGPPTSLDGLAGFFPLYFGRHLNAEQRDLVLDRSIQTWLDTQMKPWPSCRHSHPFVRAASALYVKCRPWLTLPTRVVVRVNLSAAKLCVPIEERRRPQTLQDAKYSIPFMVAFCLVHGEPSLANLSDATLTDADVLTMARLVEIEPTGGDEPGLPHACIEVLMRDSSCIRFDEPYVAPEPAVLLDRKFASCLAFAGLSGDDVDVARRVLRADQKTDCRGLLELMSVQRQVDAAST